MSIPDEIKELAKQEYGELAEPIVNLVDNREKWKRVANTFRAYREEHTYELSLKLTAAEYCVSTYTVETIISVRKL